MGKSLRKSLMLVVLAVVCGAGAQSVIAAGRVATVSGSVRDNKGNPIAGALVSLIKDGTDQIIKQVRSLADGSFIARIVPGRYTLRAIADGFSAVLFDFDLISVHAFDHQMPGHLSAFSAKRSCFVRSLHFVRI